MKLSGPFTYRITFNSEKITSVKAPNGDDKFSGEASRPVPKLYVISSGQRPIYVGVTKQRIGDRLRMGFQPSGVHGYHGYAWRHGLSSANVDIWLQEDSEDSTEIETVEAEVVFQIRHIYDQWPEYQTEIHFHPSEPAHRAAAMEIVDHYRSL